MQHAFVSALKVELYEDVRLVLAQHVNEWSQVESIGADNSSNSSSALTSKQQKQVLLIHF